MDYHLSRTPSLASLNYLFSKYFLDFYIIWIGKEYIIIEHINKSYALTGS